MPWGQITAFQMGGKRIDMRRCDDASLSIGGHDSEVPIIGVFDLMAVLPSNAPVLDGSIGIDVFKDRAISIDQVNGWIVIETPRTLA